MTNSVLEWPALLPGYFWLPCYWAEAGKPFKGPPTLLVVHSGSVAPWVAEYMTNPLGVQGQPGAVKVGNRWLRQVAAHFCWYSGRESKVRRGLVLPPYKDGFVQQVSLRRQAWHAGGSRCRGRGAVNSRSIGVELPGPASGPRNPRQRSRFRRLVSDLQAALPSLRHWTRHSDVDRGKRDPGPGFTAEWMDGLGMEWVK